MYRYITAGLLILFFSENILASTLTFEGQSFGTQSWTENGVNWSFTGSGDIRTTAAINGSCSGAPRNSTSLQANHILNVSSLWLYVDDSNDDNTFLTIKGYNSAGTLVNTKTENNPDISAFQVSFSGFTNITRLEFTFDGTGVVARIDDVVYTDVGPLVITSNGTGGGNWATGSTWVGGIAPAAGNNAVIAAGDVVTLDANATAANCTVNNGGTLDASTFTLTVSALFTLQAAATFKQGGTVNTAPGATRSFNSSSTFIFNGSQGSISGYYIFGNLTWNSSTAISVINGNLTVNGNLTILSRTLRFSSGTPTQNMNHTIAGNLIIDGVTSSAMTNGNGGVTPGSVTLNITGDIITQNNGIFSVNSGGSGSSTINLSGNLTNNGGFGGVNGTGTIILSFTGTSNQVVSGNDIEWVKDIEIDNSAGVTLSTNFSVGTSVTETGVVTFTTGKVTLNSSIFTIGSNGSISGAGTSKYFVTNGTAYLKRSVPNTNTDISFPVGTTTNYLPAIINNNGGTSDDYSIRAVQSTSNVVNANGVVGAQWAITEAANNGSNVALTLQWNGSDEGASFSGSRSSGQVGRYSGSGTNWTLLGTTVSGAGPYTAITTSPITGSGVFSSSVYSVGLPSILPVELSSFSAKFAGSGIELSWQTITEINNYGFEIQRLQDYKIERLKDWETVGFVKGSGNSNSTKIYSYTDENPFQGKSYYRLKQIDSDGQFEYSKTVEASFPPEDGHGMKLDEFKLEQNYPNPFNPTTTISYSIPKDGKVKLVVYNLLGQIVGTIVDEVKENGSYSVDFDAAGLSSGVYIYKLEAEGFNISNKMTVLK